MIDEFLGDNQYRQCDEIDTVNAAVHHKVAQNAKEDQRILSDIG
jgi:hypothetical protein